MAEEKHSMPAERDEPIKIDLDRETTLRVLLKVDPGAEPVDEDSELRHDAE